jgi:hypothetical protein
MAAITGLLTPQDLRVACASEYFIANQPKSTALNTSNWLLFPMIQNSIVKNIKLDVIMKNRVKGFLYTRL